MSPQPIDNSQFTEEQRTEAYRREHIALAGRQVKALESIRGLLILLVVVLFIGLVAAGFIISVNARV